jgi:hypothetical protein
MSRLRANQITNENANGAPNFPHGLTVTGIVTATTTSTTLPQIVVGSAVTANSQGIDITGVATATSLKVGSSIIANSTGINVTGVITATSFSGIDSDKISEGNTEVETVDTGSDGHIKITTEGSERWRVNNIGIMTSYYTGNRGGMSLLGAFQAEVASTQGEGIVRGVTTDNIHCFDSCGWYNNTNWRYTPQVKGHYMFNLTGQYATDMSGSSIEQSLAFQLNGTSVSQYAYGYTTNYGNYDYVQISQMVFCNGTTDYVNAWLNSSRSPNINSTTKWSGYLVHPVA